MRKSYDTQETEKLIKEYDIDQFFDNMNLPFYTIQYEKGEFLHQPNETNNLFQIGISGEISIYHIRPDGEKYFLAQNEDFFKLGCVELVMNEDMQVYAEAVTNTKVIALSLDQNRHLLLEDNKFLKMVVFEMAQIITYNLNYKAKSLPLPERVINHIKYNCSDNILKGVEKAAFQLHCSSRQLQRVLNELESQNVIDKCGKGTYKLLQINN